MRSKTINETIGTGKYKNIFYGLMLLLFAVPTFMRGLYFEKELLIVSAFTGLVILFAVFTGTVFNRGKLSVNPMDYGAVALLILYVISTFYAAHYRDALLYDIKYFIYIAVYFSISYAIREKLDAKWIFRVIYASALITSIAGIGAYLGTFEVSGGINFGRISSFIQYPNTLAVYLAVAFVLGLYLANFESWRFAAPLYYTGNFLILTTFWGTGSRGALAAIGFAIVAGIVFLRKENVLNSLIQFLPGFVLSFLEFKYILLKSVTYASAYKWGSVILAIILVAVVNYFLVHLLTRVSINKPRTVIVSSLVVICLVGGVVWWAGNAKSSTENVFKKITFSDRNLRERITFDQDALKIIKDFPMGTGGGGFAAVNRKYQGHLYVAKEVHNYFLQTAVETGVIGLIALLSVWGAMLVNLYSIWKTGSPGLKIGLAAGIGAITLGLHSLMDFDMSLGLMSIILWGLFGIIRGLAESETKTQGSGIGIKPVYGRVLAGVITVGFIVISLSLLLGIYYTNKGADLGSNSDLPGAYKYMSKAHLFDPLNFKIDIDLSQIQMNLAQQEQNKEKLLSANKWAAEAIKLNPWDPEARIQKAKVDLLLSEVEEASREIETAQQLSPLFPRYYDALSEIYLLKGKYYLMIEDKEKAKKAFEAVTQVPGRAEKQNARIPENRRNLAPQLYITELMQKNTQQATQMLQQLAK